MTFPNTWNALDWWIPALVMVIVALPIVFWADWSRRMSFPFKLVLSACKVGAIGLLAFCLLEPMQTFTRPVPGANSLIVLADASQSLNIKDPGSSSTRAEILKNRLEDKSAWLTSLDNQFELRRYQFDSRLDAVTDFRNYRAAGQGSAIVNSLSMLGKRLTGKPSAGIVLLTDGNTSENLTDDEFDLETLPPIYPIVVGSDRPARDLALNGISTSQSNFESAPVTIKAELVAHGYAGETVKVELLGQDNKLIEVQEVRRVEDGRPFAVRFQLKPKDRGVNVFRVRTFVAGTSLDDGSAAKMEATLINNQRTVLVDRGRGPFRILYLAGRPNWEYKFMRRAIADDNELNLVGLLRVAGKEPKFTFRGHQEETTNPLFRGFGNQADATAEQYDEPVLIRLDTRDGVELRNGFPTDAATLFEYDAIVLDDLEAGFFTQDQKTLVSQFVTLRGGGLLMLGGANSFAAGKYDRTPIGEMLPVYLDEHEPVPTNMEYRLDLTRDGWVQPWTRIESTRESDEKRIAEMPAFRTLNLASSIKPGATVLANVRMPDEKIFPALVAQQFGKGRTAALLIGDLWRWKMNTRHEDNDLDKSWRQTLRWLVSDVPRRVEVTVKPANNESLICVQVYDAEYKPQLNSEVELTVTSPSGKEIKLTAGQDAQKAGRYESRFVSRETGAYRVLADVNTPVGKPIEKRESGWVSDPASAEFQSLVPNREFLQKLATRTGGQLIALDDLDAFASSFENRKVPISETQTRPWWHRWWIFLTAICLLVVEWGTRRMKGLA